MHSRSPEARTGNKGLPKWGRAEAVFQLFVHQFGFSQLDVINLAMCISSTFIFKFRFNYPGQRNSIGPTSASPERVACNTMRILFTSILLFFSVSALGQKARNDFLISFVDSSSGLYGYRTPKGQVIIPAKYFVTFTDTMYNFAFVADKDKLMGINTQGHIILEPFNYDNGPDYVQEGLFRYVEKGKIGFANLNGQKLIAAKFDFVRPFQNDLAAFNVGGHKQYHDEHWFWEGGLWGFINKKGDTVIKPTFISVKDFDKALAEVVTQDRRKVQINKKGQIVKVLSVEKSTAN